MSSIVAQQKYDAKYDLLKFVLSLLVMAVHTVDLVWLYPWLRIAVPLFFVMSSYFFFLKINNSSQEQQKSVIKKFVLRNVQLYMCWFVILSPITYIIRRHIYESTDFVGDIVIFIKRVVFGATFAASWFIPATIIGVLIIYGLGKLLKNNYFIFVSAILAFVLVTLQSSYLLFIEDTFVSTVINKHIDIFGEFIWSFPSALFWVFIGKLFAEDKIKIKSTKLLIVLLLINCVGLFVEWRWVINLNSSYKNDSYFMLAPVCILLFALVQKIKPIYWANSIYFKRASTIIFVSHGSIRRVISKCIALVLGKEIDWLLFLITLIICLVVYMVIESLIKKIGQHRITELLKMLY